MSAQLVIWEHIGDKITSFIELLEICCCLTYSMPVSSHSVRSAPSLFIPGHELHCRLPHHHHQRWREVILAHGCIAGQNATRYFLFFLMLFKCVFSYSDLIRGFYQVETGHGNARKVREMSAKLSLYTPTKSWEEVKCKTPVSVNQGGAELKTLMWSECVPMKIEEKLEYSIKSKT